MKSFWRCVTVLLFVAFGLLSKIHADTQLIAWGPSSWGQTNVPTDLTNVVAMAAGDGHVLALRADGTVVAWGQNDYGQAIVPSDATNVYAVAAGSTHSLALRGDGTVRFWGNIYSQSVTQAPPEAGINMVDLGLGPGAQHVVQLRADGTVLEWGNTDPFYNLTNAPLSATNIVAVAAGAYSGIALRSNGTVAAWGTSLGAPLGVPGNANGIKEIAAGFYHVLALRTNRTLLAWGESSSGATVPVYATNITSIACGGEHNLALRGDGKLLAWGRNSHGQTNVPTALSNVVAIAGMSWASMALVANDGPPLLGRPLVVPGIAGLTTRLKIRSISATPMTYQWMFDGTNLPAGTNSVLEIPNVQFSQAGGYSVIVSNMFGATTNSDMTLNVLPVLISAQPTNQTALIGGSITLNVKTTGQNPLTYQWRLNGTNLVSRTNSSLTLTNAQFVDAGGYSVAVSNTFGGTVSAEALVSVVPSIIISPPRDVYSFPRGTATFSIGVQAHIPLSYQWKRNGTNLPNVSSSLTLTNLQYGDAGTYEVVTSNAYETKTNSAALVVAPVAGWGLNSFSQTNTPAVLSNIVAVAAGALHSVALGSDGRPVVWGGDVPRRTVPVDLTDAVAISAGGWGSAALKSNGTVAVWGTGPSSLKNIPAQATNIVAVAVGQVHNLALRSDGKIVGWGQNVSGESTPPADLSNVVAIAAGSQFSLALKSDGRVAAWGYNGTGQTNVPTTLSNVVAIAAGYIHGLALKADGTVAVWGSSSYDLQNIPLAATNIVAIEAGYGHCLALKPDGTVIAWGYPYNGETNLPSGLSAVIGIAAGSFHNLALVGDNYLPFHEELNDPAWTPNNFRASLMTQSGRTYRLEFKNSIEDPEWTALPLVAGTGSRITLTDPSAVSSQRLYRVRSW